MGQIHGSGAGNWNNAASVDSSEGAMQGRLMVSSSGTSTQIYDGEIGPAIIDAATNSNVAIEHEHHEIHDGHFFTLFNNQTIANLGSFNYLINTPNGSSWAHMSCNLSSQAAASFILFEGATVSNSGTQLICYDRNRNSDNDCNVEIWLTPTIIASGEMIQVRNWGTAKALGAEVRTENEWILKSGTSYIFSSRNGTTSDNIVTTWFNWYEHTDKTKQY